MLCHAYQIAFQVLLDSMRIFLVERNQFLLICYMLFKAMHQLYRVLAQNLANQPTNNVDELKKNVIDLKYIVDRVK